MKKSFWLKLIVLALAISMVVSLAACNNNKPEETETSDTPAQSTTAEKPGENNETTAPKDETTAPKDETTAPKEDTTEPKDETTEPKDETTAPKDETTAPKEDTTTVPAACEHEWTYEITDADHTEVCSKCGETGETAAHDIATKIKGVSHECVCGLKESCPVSVGFQKDETQHWYNECTLCGINSVKVDHAYVCAVEGESHKCVCGATADCPYLIESDAEGHWITGCTVCNLESAEKAVHTDPVLTKTEADGKTTYTYACDVCGFAYDERTVTVGADGINWYSAPDAERFFRNTWNTGGDGGMKRELGNLNYDPEENIVYTHITLQEGGAFAFISCDAVTSNNSSYANQTIYGSGRYAVVKMRVGEDIRGLKFGAWDGITPDNNGGADRLTDGNFRNGSNFISGWAIYVIDLANVYVKSGENSYTIDNDELEIALFTFKNGMNETSAGYYLDIAYFAVADDWTEIEALAGDEYVYLIETWKNAGDGTDIPVKYNPDGTPVEVEVEDEA